MKFKVYLILILPFLIVPIQIPGQSKSHLKRICLLLINDEGKLLNHKISSKVTEHLRETLEGHNYSIDSSIYNSPGMLNKMLKDAKQNKFSLQSYNFLRNKQKYDILVYGAIQVNKTTRSPNTTKRKNLLSYSSSINLQAIDLKSGEILGADMIISPSSYFDNNHKWSSIKNSLNYLFSSKSSMSHLLKKNSKGNVGKKIVLSTINHGKIYSDIAINKLTNNLILQGHQLYRLDFISHKHGLSQVGINHKLQLASSAFTSTLHNKSNIEYLFFLQSSSKPIELQNNDTSLKASNSTTKLTGLECKYFQYTVPIVEHSIGYHVNKSFSQKLSLINSARKISKKGGDLYSILSTTPSSSEDEIGQKKSIVIYINDGNLSFAKDQHVKKITSLLKANNITVVPRSQYNAFFPIKRINNILIGNIQDEDLKALANNGIDTLFFIRLETNLYSNKFKVKRVRTFHSNCKVFAISTKDGSLLSAVSRSSMDTIKSKSISHSIEKSLGIVNKQKGIHLEGPAIRQLKKKRFSNASTVAMLCFETKYSLDKKVTHIQHSATEYNFFEAFLFNGFKIIDPRYIMPLVMTPGSKFTTMTFADLAIAEGFDIIINTSYSIGTISNKSKKLFFARSLQGYLKVILPQNKEQQNLIPKHSEGDRYTYSDNIDQAIWNNSQSDAHRISKTILDLMKK